MDAELLDFNQLLQRDLDDHRVAINLIPYLLRPRATGPAFFPPIVAVLLPFKNKRPSELPEIAPEEFVKDGEGNWMQATAGEAMRVRRLALRENVVHPISVGELHWNDAHARLVVIDGQHRAMALLAIERTVTNTWDQSGGERFKSFYEVPVRRELARWQKNNGVDLDLSKVEVPVAVCWFPEQSGPSGDPHAVARKLFVDVNKEARQPSESRLILLSDGELLKVLTRSLLNQLRSGESDRFLPLYAVEYDNPETKTTQSARWSALTNIHLLQMSVDRCLFGPPKYINNVDVTFGGRESETERDAFMRGQLELKDMFPGPIEDGEFTYLPGEIGNLNFPIGKKEELTSRFMSSWGEAILTLLSGVAHYEAHATALTQIKEHWAPGDVLARLARDALFGGVGVYWTLRDSSEHFKHESTLPGSSGKRTKPDIVKAWEFLQSKQDPFERQRAKSLLGSDNADSVARSNEIYAVMNTHACQLGMMLTLGTLWKIHVHERPLKDLPNFAEALTAGWNAYFLQEEWSGKAKDRRRVLAKKVTTPVNMIASMDTPQAVYFRYFWLEILASDVAWPHLSVWVADRVKFNETVGGARSLYRALLVKQREKALKNSNPEMGDTERRASAEESADAALQRALHAWFEMTKAKYEDWKTSVADVDLMVENGNEGGEATSTESPSSLEDAMAEDSFSVE